MSALSASKLLAARDGLLRRATTFFLSQPGIVGVFLGGSLPGGRGDVYSDIDLRVIVSHQAHRDFVARRLEIPQSWDGFLSNEWLDGAIHCVSHFRPFLKIDIFYLDESEFKPSPWLKLPIKILHDPQNLIASVAAQSAGLAFNASKSEISRSIGKGIAAAHETYRRLQRRELIYAQSLLEELRFHIICADNWLNDHMERGHTWSHLKERLSSDLFETLSNSYVRIDFSDIEKSLIMLTTVYRTQIQALHAKYRLSRDADLDMEAVEIPLRLTATP